MRGHAGAEIEGDAIEMIAAAGGAIRSALLQAGDMRIAIVPAARALGEVAAERRQMTDLRRCESKRSRRQARMVLVEARVGRDGGYGGEAPDARRPVGAPADSDRVEPGRDIDQRSLRNSAAPPFGKVGAGGAEFRALARAGHECGCHAAALPFSPAIRRSGRIGISVERMPGGLRMALARAGEVGTGATSPLPTLPPSTWAKPPSSKCTSLSGVSASPGMRESSSPPVRTSPVF